MTSTIKQIENVVQQRPAKVLKGMAIVVLVIVFLLILVTINRKVSGQKDRVKVPDAGYINGGGDVTQDFLKNGLMSFVSELEKTLLADYWFWQDRSARCDALKRLYETINDNELIAVHNAFKNQFKTTIHRLLLAKEDGCGISWLWIGDGLNMKKEYGHLLLQRINKLQLP
jgi:hypothetical protein